MLTDAVSDFLGYVGGGELSSEGLLPYRDHIADDVLLLTDGSVVSMRRAPGAPFALQSVSERNAHTSRHIAWLNAIADDNVEVWEYLIKHDGVPEASRNAGKGYAATFLNEYDAMVAAKLRAVEWFVAVRVKPRRGLGSRMGWRKREWVADISQLEEAMRLFDVILRHTKPVRLGLRDEGGISYSEIAEALYLARTGRSAKQPLVDEDGLLGDALYTDDAICGRRGFEIRHAPNGGDSTFGVMCGFRVYPRGKINVSKFDELLAIDGRFVMLNVIRFQTRAQAQDSLDLLKRYAYTSNDPAVSDTDDLEAAIDEVASGRRERGETRWSLALHGNSLAEVDRLVSAAKNIVANAGAKLTTEAPGSFPTYWGQMPGAKERMWIRLAQISTRQFSMLSSLCGYPRGPGKTRWGSPVLRFPTLADTAYDWDLFVGDVGHTPILGPNGSGKTVLLGSIIMALDASIRAKGGTQILLDVDESNANTILALGGSYVSIRSGEDSGVAPLRGLPNTPRVRLMLREFVAGLSMWNDGAPPTPAERRGIADGVDFVMGEAPPEQRRMGIIRRFMGNEDGGAGDRFEAWCRDFDGEHAWAFDGDLHDVDFNVPLAGTDLTHVMNDKHIMPPMAVLLLWMASDVMDGRRCVLWAEEAPAYMPEPRFARIFKGIALRARKRNAAFCPIAQMPEHLLENEAGLALLKQARQMILLPNDKAEEATYRTALGCTAPEFEMVREKMIGLPFRSALIKRSDGQSTVVQFDLTKMERHLAVLSSTPSSVRLLRSCMESAGNDAKAFLPEFWRRIHEVAV